ncbi:DUF805 domain-containing protein [Enterococcus sp. AZ109]|uniref:DUF805 domain-containing protein n=1 Tax=Enterococcus sp. AZ109 TaxID=2774634 RepID=UPI003F26EB40
MVDAYKKFWENFGNYSGVTGRKEYWLASIASILVQLVFVILMVMLDSESILFLLLMCFLVIFSGVTFLCSISLKVRRLRDAGFHWAFMFIGLVPYIGSIASIVLVCMPTKQQPKITDELEF